MAMSDHCARCERLRAELRVYRMADVFDIGPGRARILDKLYERSPSAVGKAALLAVAHARDHAHTRSPNLLAVHINCLRSIVGAEIVTHHGIGYSLTARGKADIDEMLGLD